MDLLTLALNLGPLLALTGYIIYGLRIHSGKIDMLSIEIHKRLTEQEADQLISRRLEAQQVFVHELQRRLDSLENKIDELIRYSVRK